MPPPQVTVVVPVFNRQNELRRALNSLVSQSMRDFECIVVDDASTRPIRSIVEAYDERFIYVRNKENVGPTGARVLGFERMRGETFMGLDSDNELFPWAIERAVASLRDHPEVAGVSGLFVFPDGLLVRVPGRSRVVTPTDYAKQKHFIPDCVGAFRRNVVDEWLTKRSDYYMFDFHYVLTFQMRHSQLYVDEPWGRYHTDSADRVSVNPDPRQFRDAVVFVEEHRPLLGTTPCLPLDAVLRRYWFMLWRAGRRDEARVVRSWLAERGVGVKSVAPRRLASKVFGSLSRRVVPRPVNV